MGSRIAAVALSFLIYERTGSALWLAGTLFFTFGVTGFLTPLAGKIADRYDRRAVMIASDLLSLATWLLLVFVRAPILLASIGFVASVVALPFQFAASAAIPNIVDEDDLPWANGLMSAAHSTATLAGPAIGGALYALGGAGLAFAVNACSFGLSALLAWSVRGVRFSAEQIEGEERSVSSLEGFRVIRRDPFLLWITVAWTCMWLAMNIAYVADPPLAKSFGVGAFGFGLIDTTFGLGALLGSLVATRIVRGREYAWLTTGMLGVAAGWLMIAATPWFVLVLVGSALAAGIDAVGNVAGYSLIQMRAEDAVRGRVFAAQTTAGLGANMIGFLLVGPLVEALGPQTVYACGGLLALVAAALFVIPTRGRIEPTRADAADPLG
jgi:predicted MFS family arabinose efflux permease